MSKEEFLQLQSDHHHSGLSLKSYLKPVGTGYSTYNYWRKKYCSESVASRRVTRAGSPRTEWMLVKSEE